MAARPRQLPVSGRSCAAGTRGVVLGDQGARAVARRCASSRRGWRRLPTGPATPCRGRPEARQSWKLAVRAAVSPGAGASPGTGRRPGRHDGRRPSVKWACDVEAHHRCARSPAWTRDIRRGNGTRSDGRIVRLGLHRTTDPSLGHDAEATIWALTAASRWPELAWLTDMTEAERRAYAAEHDRRTLRSRRTGASPVVAPAVGDEDRSREPPPRRRGARLNQRRSSPTRVAAGAAILITDAAGPPKLHPRPRECRWVTSENFVAKVVTSGGRNGRYYRVEDLSAAAARWPRLTHCAVCAVLTGSAGGARRCDRVRWLLPRPTRSVPAIAEESDDPRRHDPAHPRRAARRADHGRRARCRRAAWRSSR